MKSKAPIKYPFKEELIHQIKKEVGLHSVYVISINKEKRKQDVYLEPKCKSSKELIIYTLLIVGYRPLSKSLGDLTDDLYNRMQQRCKVYAIYYAFPKAVSKLDYGDNFLLRVLNGTTCLFKDNKDLSRFHGFTLIYHKTIYKQLKEDYNGRMERAGYLLSIIDSIDLKDEPTSRLFIMSNAIEQICLALLILYWEFKPAYYSLPYLMHLCSHFTDLPKTIFPNNTFNSQRIFYILCNVRHFIRFKSRNEYSGQEVDKCYTACERFYGEAQRQGSTYLREIKEVHYNTPC